MNDKQIKDLIARIGIVYTEHFFKAQEMFAKTKHEEDEKILFIYQKAYLVFNDLSINMDIDNFVKSGKQFREIQTNNAGNEKIQEILSNLFKAFKVANALLNCKEGE